MKGALTGKVGIINDLTTSKSMGNVYFCKVLLVFWEETC